MKIQSLYGSPEKRDFVKAADASRAVRLRECPLGELTLLDYLDHVTYFPALAAPMVGMNMPFREKFNWLKTHREN